MIRRQDGAMDGRPDPSREPRHLAGKWRDALLAPSSGHRRRLPRDVVGSLVGAATATTAWLLIANGVGTAPLFRTSLGESWLVALPAAVGTGVVLVIALGVAVFGRRWWLMAEVACSSLSAAAGCAAVGLALDVGPGHASSPPLIGATVAAALLFGRSLAVPLRPFWWAVVLAGLLAETIHTDLLPLGTLGAAGAGLLVGSLVLAVVGTGDGLPTTASVESLIGELGLRVDSVEASISPTWGMARYLAQERQVGNVTIDIYGRDLPEGQFIARLWRFMWIRRSTLELHLRPADHIERVVGAIHWVRALGLPTQEVIAADRIAVSGEAVLVTRAPEGISLDSVERSAIDAAFLERVWRAHRRIWGVGIALRRIHPSGILLGASGEIGFGDLTHAEVMASDETLDSDIAILLVETARLTDVDAALSACLEVIGRTDLLRALPLVQPQVVPQAAVHQPRAEVKKELAGLRRMASEAMDVEPVEPVPLTRMQPQRLGMFAATFVGIWLLIEQLAGFDNILDVLKKAQWSWVLIALALSQTTALTEAISISGASPTPIPLGPLALLRSATDFTGLVGGTVGRTATIVRFYQRRGLSRTVAVSSGVMYSVAGFVVQMVLLVLALLLTLGEFKLPSASSTTDTQILQKLLILVVIFGAVGAIAFYVPKVRRIFDSRIRPEMTSAWSNLRTLMANPQKLMRIFGGQALSQLLAALSLGAALHAVGGSTSVGGLLAVCTVASLLGGLSPVPGGMGVMEATYISGLTLLGVPENVAIGGTLLFRLCTTYLPPIWGWASLVWLQRREMV